MHAARLPLRSLAVALAVSIACNVTYARTDGPQAQPALPPGLGHVQFEHPPAIDVDAGDDVPLPQKPELITGDASDRIVGEAGGDPFVLKTWSGTKKPSANEAIDARLLAAVDALGQDQRPSAEVYGFVMFAKRQTPARLAELEALGVRFLGFFPHHAQRAAIPAAALDALASHPSVRWIGVADPWQKMHPALLETLPAAGAKIDVMIATFENDLNAASTYEQRGTASAWDPGAGAHDVAMPDAAGRMCVKTNGWQEAALARLGFETTAYEPAPNAFIGHLPTDRLAELLDLDFVQAIEPTKTRTLGAASPHEESIPLINGDWGRKFYDGNSSLDPVAGEIDSGMRASHEAIGNHFLLGVDMTGTGMWTDTCNGGSGHGTHVAGTILGDPPLANQRYRGMAPGLGKLQVNRFRQVKEFGVGGTCAGAGSTYDALFGHFRTTLFDGQVTVAIPQVINNSWGSGPGPAGVGWFGSESNCVAVDAEVWNQNQVWVWIAHNHGPSSNTLSVEASSKNALTVTNVTDSFAIGPGQTNQAPSVIFSQIGNGASSQGPCADGRWKPNVAAPGHLITSALSSSDAAYGAYNGTSMAGPHVTGLVAQLCDHYAFLSHNPAAMHALLMATATPFQGQQFKYPAPAWANQYGAGRIDAYRAHYPDAQAATFVPSFPLLAGQGNTGDFTVGPGAKRLVVVLHWLEAPASVGAGTALLNDLDLYVDVAPFTAGTNTGEWSSISTVDNTEIRTIENPAPGNYRWKVHPYASVASSKCAVAYHILTGDQTPAVTFDVSASDSFVKPQDPVWIYGSAACPEFVADGAFVDVTSTAGATKIKTSTTLEDGVITNLTNNGGWSPQDSGFDVMLGDIVHDDLRVVEWNVKFTTEGTKTFTANLVSGNAASVVDSAVITVDGTQPGLPGSIQSTTHVLGQWSKQTAMTFTWTSASDSLSGIDGYSVVLAQGGPAAPDTVKDIGNVTTFATSAPGTGSYWFCIRAVDNSGNWGTPVSSGPYHVDLALPNPVTNLNSTTHAANVWSNAPLMTCTWTTAADAHSGIDGYSVLVSQGAPALPGTTKHINAVTSYTQNLGSSATPWFFSIRSVDKAGNWDDGFVSFGPIKIDMAPPTTPTLTCSTHVVNTWSTLATLQIQFGSIDPTSGVDKYGLLTDSVPTSNPVFFLTPSTTTSAPINLTASHLPYYIHVAAKDLAGNVSATTHLGPFYIDNVAPVFGHFAIENDAAFTATPTVALQMSASNAASGLALMRFKNDGGAFSAWETYAGTKSWNLTQNGGASTKGTRSVVIEVQDTAGNVTSDSDTIHWYTPVTYVGTSCAGSLGAPSFTIDGIPAFGETITFNVTNSAATTGLLYVGVSTAFWGSTQLPLLVPNTTCSIWTSLDVLLYSGPVFPLPAVIPAMPVIANVPLNFQWLLGGDATSPNYVVTTRAAKMTISGP